jgi:hypothetical protein
MVSIGFFGKINRIKAKVGCLWQCWKKSGSVRAAETLFGRFGAKFNFSFSANPLIS